MYYSIKNGIIDSRPFITGQIDANSEEDLKEKLNILKKEGWEPVGKICNGSVKHHVKYVSEVNRKDIPYQKYFVMKIIKYLAN